MDPFALERVQWLEVLGEDAQRPRVVGVEERRVAVGERWIDGRHGLGMVSEERPARQEASVDTRSNVAAARSDGPSTSRPTRAAAIPTSDGSALAPIVAAHTWRPIALAVCEGPTRAGVTAMSDGKIGAQPSPMRTSPARPIAPGAAQRIAEPARMARTHARRKTRIAMRSATMPSTTRPSVKLAQYADTQAAASPGETPRASVKRA